MRRPYPGWRRHCRFPVDPVSGAGPAAMLELTAPVPAAGGTGRNIESGGKELLWQG